MFKKQLYYWDEILRVYFNSDRHVLTNIAFPNQRFTVFY